MIQETGNCPLQRRLLSNGVLFLTQNQTFFSLPLKSCGFGFFFSDRQLGALTTSSSRHDSICTDLSQFSETAICLLPATIRGAT